MLVCCSLSGGITRAIKPVSGFCNSHDRLSKQLLMPPTSNRNRFFMQKNRYLNVWLAFVQLEAEPGENFDNLIDKEVPDANPTYIGAWANVLVDAIALKEVPDLIEQGLRELKFQPMLIQKVENTAMLVEEGELKESVVKEIAYMLQHGYKFMISDKIFSYAEGEE